MSDDTNDERFVDKRSAARMAAGEEKPEPKVEPEGAEAPAAETPVDELAAEREKAETYYKNWQRSAADFANYKRRTEQERGESARLVNAAMVINLLPVFDDLDRAVASVDAQLAGLNWVQGVSAIHQKFARMLEAMGVKDSRPKAKHSTRHATKPSASSRAKKARCSTSSKRATSSRAKSSARPWSSWEKDHDASPPGNRPTANSHQPDLISQTNDSPEGTTWQR